MRDLTVGNFEKDFLVEILGKDFLNGDFWAGISR